MSGHPERAKEIVANAMELDYAERPGYVEQACAGDAELQQEVEALLDAGDPQSPAPDIGPRPARIGKYRIGRRLRRGRRGSVYLGNRDDGQMDQVSAIEIVEGCPDAGALVRRFADEHALQHPNIAQLFHVGVFEERPYFAMEYIEGEPLIEFANRNKLSIKKRIRLFLPVCSAVEYANSKLVSHGGIAAREVLVDASGTPKLLHFGWAKLLDEPAATTDVHALGLLLDELLGRKRPLDPELKEIVLKAIGDEPADGGLSAADLGKALGRYLAVARSTVRFARVHAFAAGVYALVVRKRRWLAIAALVLLAAGIGAISIVERRRSQRRDVASRQLARLEGAIANLPDAAPARELAIKRSVQSLDSLSREAPNDTGLKRELAEAYLRVGDTQRLGRESVPGNFAAASASYRKAVALLGGIAQSAPSDMRAQTDVARARNQLAAAMGRDGYVKEGFEMLDKQASSLKALGAKKPLDAPARFVLARTYFGLAEFHRVGGQPWLALDAALQSVRIFQDLAEKDAKNREALRWWAASEKRLAALYLVLSQPSKAAEHLTTSMKLDKQRMEQDPADALAKMDLTRDQTYLAEWLHRKGDLAGAQALLEAAISAGKAALDAEPNNYLARYVLANDYEQLGDLLRDEKRPDDARARYREGVSTAAALRPQAGDPDATKVIASLRTKAAGGAVRP